VKGVEAFFFGSHERLFGMYHPPVIHPRGHGVVVCPPLFNEYYRSHFTLKRIATELARKGYDVLRFDYFGTGDSRGVIPSSPFDTWSRDIGDGIHEVRRLASCRQVSAITARFSASLALAWQHDLGKYICWDPVFDGREYLKQMNETHSASLAEHVKMSETERKLHKENDFLGTGISRASFERSLARFESQLDDENLSSLPGECVEVDSEAEWISAGLEMIYAHDVIKRVTDAL
jgi:pimeloyl-ACP methyl ester carboxylesterase